MERRVKARKEYRCDRCNGIIRVGNLHRHVKLKLPRYDERDRQIGIEYISFRVHLNQDCAGRLQGVYDVAAYFSGCLKGEHQYIADTVFDHYAHGFPVYVPTGGLICTACGHQSHEDDE